MAKTEITLGRGFSEMTETEQMDCEGGVVWWAAAAVLGGSFVVGWAVGYIFG